MTNEADDAVKKAGVGRKQWAAPCDSLVQVLVNADMTSSSAGGSLSLTDDDTTQSLSGYCQSLSVVHRIEPQLNCDVCLALDLRPLCKFVKRIGQAQ